jgi:hypothetical protein
MERPRRINCSNLKGLVSFIALSTITLCPPSRQHTVVEGTGATRMALLAWTLMALPPVRSLVGVLLFLRSQLTWTDVHRRGLAHLWQNATEA